MVDFLRHRASPRKLRLFICASGRLLHPLRPARDNQEREAAIAVDERFADGLASVVDLDCVAEGSWTVAAPDTFFAAHLCAWAKELKVRIRAGLLHCLFGNPFRALAFKAAWRTPDVIGLARAAYENRVLPRGDRVVSRLGVGGAVSWPPTARR
jgi:hypothetical protein